MKLTKPKAELLIQPDGMDGIYKQIELAGRTCYRSEDKITEDSAKPFVDRMILSNHKAMLEHGTVYLFIPEKEYNKQLSLYSYGVKACERYGRIHFEEGGVYVTTNYRVIVEHNLYYLLDFICEPTEFHEKRYTFRCITSIGVTREMNRHRVNSIAEQSTRYCNYSKNKFGGEVSFCIPAWMPQTEKTVDTSNGFGVLAGEELFAFLGKAERHYFYLLEQGWQPQQAREVLPLCTATEIIHTAFASDWKHFFDLRYFGTTGKPHPNMYQLATLMKEEAEKHGIWNEINNSNNM